MRIMHCEYFDDPYASLVLHCVVTDNGIGDSQGDTDYVNHNYNLKIQSHDHL